MTIRRIQMPPVAYPDLPPTRPMPAPVSGDATDAPIASFTAEMTDGREHLLARAMFPEPTAVGLLLFAPRYIQGQGNTIQSIILGNDGVGGVKAPSELWILGQAEIGAGGVCETVRFDIPLVQAVQLATVCQTLKVTCRLYAAQDPAGGSYNPATFDNPPQYNGTTESLAGMGGAAPFNIVRVQSVLAPGFSGRGNLTRRIRTGLVAHGGGFSPQIYAPSGATMWRVFAGANMYVQPSALVPSTIAPTFTGTSGFGVFAADAVERPVPESMKSLLVQNTDPANDMNAEVVWRLGLSGFPS